MIGASPRRKEDQRLLTGGGRFVDDLTREGVLHLGVVRSAEAHARLTKVATEAAREVVRCVGEPVAVVVAESRSQLADALDAVTVSYERLPALATAEAALVSPTHLHEGWP